MKTVGVLDAYGLRKDSVLEGVAWRYERIGALKDHLTEHITELRPGLRRVQHVYTLMSCCAQCTHTSMHTYACIRCMYGAPFRRDVLKQHARS